MEKILYNAMFSKIQKEILNNKEEIKKLEKTDLKYCNIKIDIKKIIEIIELYKTKNIENYNIDKYIFCNGNPYNVVNLAMISIINNIYMKININNIMLGVNKYIIEIINKILKENKLNIQIELFEKIEENKKIIFLDRINEFNIIKNKNKKLITLESIDIYSEEIEYEELFEKIYNYAIDNCIDIDIFNDEGIETMLKYGKGNKKIILTSNQEIIEKNKNKNIYINENPFKNENIIFNEQLIYEIIN